MHRYLASSSNTCGSCLRSTCKGASLRRLPSPLPLIDSCLGSFGPPLAKFGGGGTGELPPLIHFLTCAKSVEISVFFLRMAGFVMNFSLKFYFLGNFQISNFFLKVFRGFFVALPNVLGFQLANRGK